MSPNERPHIFVQYNPEAGARNLVVIVKDKPKEEQGYPGILGSEMTWMR